ncbi:MAG: dTMP kinase [Methanobacterium sp.]|uniref:dTMP kinase n=1 Tax=Methanobacterium sp. TaxID=2164 RepID=UPI003D64F303|nr:dTMP kinase [Methanobacterium sp.]
MYICLEGIDGSGKSTQIKLLEKWLKDYGYDVMRIFEPTNSSVGKLIREMLRDPDATLENFQKTLALLFAADRMILMDEIEAAEEKGKAVISDRCFYSSIAYQNDPLWTFELNKFVKKPNIVILLDLDVETALERCDGKDSFENKAFLEKIRENYLKLAGENDFFVLNANNGVNKIHEDIKRVISPKIGRCI